MEEDPGFDLSEKLKNILGSLAFPVIASTKLMDSLVKKRPDAMWHIPTFPRFALPTDIEDIYSLRKGRFQVFIISALHEIDTGFISMVAVAQPLMGWEVNEARLALKEGKDAPSWARDMGEDVLLEVAATYWDEPSDLSHEIRLFYPVLAEEVEDMEGDPEADKGRQKALQDIVRVLCQDNGFVIHSTESGDIPKEIKDEWISTTTLWQYNSMLEFVEKELQKEGPDDPRVLFARASLLLSRDRAEEALSVIEWAIENEALLPRLWFAKANALSKLGREEEAAEAEEKALEIQRELGTPPSRADIYTFLDPFAYDAKDLRPIEKEEDAPTGPGGVPLQCYMCKYDFLDVEEDLEYRCNRCDHHSTIMGAAMDVKVKLGKEEYIIGETIKLELHIRNKTRHRLQVQSATFEVAIEGPRKGEDRNDHLGTMKGKGTLATIEPHGETVLALSFDDLIWSHSSDIDLAVDLELMPGDHKVDLWVGAQVGPEDRGLDSATETDPISLRILPKEND